MYSGRKPNKGMLSSGTSLNPAINTPHLCRQSRWLVHEPDSFCTWHYSAPLCDKCVAVTGQGFNLLEGPAAAQDQRWQLPVRPSSNHTSLQKLPRALSPFLNGLVQLKYESKNNTWTNLCSRLGRLLHLSSLAC